MTTRRHLEPIQSVRRRRPRTYFHHHECSPQTPFHHIHLFPNPVRTNPDLLCSFYLSVSGEFDIDFTLTMFSPQARPILCFREPHIALAQNHFMWNRHLHALEVAIRVCGSRIRRQPVIVLLPDNDLVRFLNSETALAFEYWHEAGLHLIDAVVL